jgi:WD40 repeat protein
VAVGRELAAASIANLEEDPERSVLLGLAAVERTRAVDGTVLPEAEEVNDLAFSADGSLIATGAADAVVRIWRHGTSIYVPATDSLEVLVVDASTFAVVDTIEPITPYSVAIEGDGLWIVEAGGAVAQRFDL